MQHGRGYPQYTLNLYPVGDIEVTRDLISPAATQSLLFCGCILVNGGSLSWVHSRVECYHCPVLLSNQQQLIISDLRALISSRVLHGWPKRSLSLSLSLSLALHWYLPRFHMTPKPSYLKKMSFCILYGLFRHITII